MTTDQTSKDELDAWNAAVARAANRKPAEDWITLHDVEARRELATAAAELTRVRRRVSLEVAQEFAAQNDGVDAETLSSDDAAALQALVDEHPDVVAAQAEVESKETAAAEGELVFHFQRLRPDVYDALQLQHPPTDEQVEKGMIWNPVTFYPALISACSVKPLTVEQAEAIISAGTHGEAARLFAVCRNLNESHQLSLGKGSRPTAS